jgi:hypothetical protein
MLVKVAESCVETCGVRVKGEVDTATREFIHRFSFPRGSEAVIQARKTEVEGVRLVTFAPEAGEWSVDCPLCGAAISVGGPVA